MKKTKANPLGDMFVSYSHHAREAVASLIHYLADHGIPSWWDEKNLHANHIPTQIDGALTGENTAGIILWVTPEVEHSDFILSREATPGILRAQADPKNFILLMVAAGGLNREGAGRIAGAKIPGINLNEWKWVEVREGKEEKAHQEIVRMLLPARLERRPDKKFVTLSISTFPNTRPERVSIMLDWRRHFPGGRLADDPTVWQTTLLPSLSRIHGAIRDTAPGAIVELLGNPSLSASFAAGIEFRSVTRTRVVWKQWNRSGVSAAFSREEEGVDSGFGAVFEEGTEQNGELLVGVSVGRDVTQKAKELLRSVPVAGMVWIAPRPDQLPLGDPRYQALSAAEVKDLSERVITAIDQAKDRWKIYNTVHIAIAAPSGLCFLIGQLLNTFNNLTVYELISESASYFRSVSIPVSTP